MDLIVGVDFCLIGSGVFALVGVLCLVVSVCSFGVLFYCDCLGFVVCKACAYVGLGSGVILA